MNTFRIVGMPFLFTVLVLILFSCEKEQEKFSEDLYSDNSTLLVNSNSEEDCPEVDALRLDFESVFFTSDNERNIFQRNFGQLNWECATYSCESLVQDSMMIIGAYNTFTSDLLSLIVAEKTTDAEYQYSIIISDHISSYVLNSQEVVPNEILSLDSLMRQFSDYGFSDDIDTRDDDEEPGCPTFGGPSWWSKLWKKIKNALTSGGGGGAGGTSGTGNGGSSWSHWIYFGNNNSNSNTGANNSSTGGGGGQDFCSSAYEAIGFEELETMLGYMTQYENSSEFGNNIPEGLSLMNIMQSECDITDYLSFEQCANLSIGCYYGLEPQELGYYQGLMQTYNCNDLEYLVTNIGECYSCDSQESFNQYALGQLASNFEKKYGLELSGEEKSQIKSNVSNICEEDFDDEALEILFRIYFSKNKGGIPINLEQTFADCFGVPDASGNYIDCSDIEESDIFELTLFAEQPNPNTRDSYSGMVGINLNIGHSFVNLSTNYGGSSSSITFGFYPFVPVDYNATIVPMEIIDDGGHSFSSAVTIELTCSQFNQAITNSLLIQNQNYDLENYNCTDYAINVANSVSLGVLDTSAPVIYEGKTLGVMSNPGDLGEDIKLLTNGTVNPIGGIAPETNCN